MAAGKDQPQTAVFDLVIKQSGLGGLRPGQPVFDEGDYFRLLPAKNLLATQQIESEMLRRLH